MNKEKLTRIALQPLAGGSFVNWLKLLIDNGNTLLLGFEGKEKYSNLLVVKTYNDQ